MNAMHRLAAGFIGLCDVAPIMSPGQFGEPIRAHTVAWGRTIAPLTIKPD